MTLGSAEESQNSDDSRTSSHESFAVLRARKRALLGEQRACWLEGHPRRPEEFLERWPVDPNTDPDAASLVLEDYLQRRRRDQSISVVDYKQRFPAQEQPLNELIGKETARRSAGCDSGDIRFALRLPDVGDQIFGFRLLLTLGQGAFGRVFLAEQDELANRPVALKVTAIEGEEPQTLAQLLHTNIVPIYSLHESQHAGLRAVCMPYLGGASLSDLLRRLWFESPRPTSGQQLVHALEVVEAPTPEALKSWKAEAPGDPHASPPRPSDVFRPRDKKPAEALRDLSYERAAATIVAKLADGLHHAHERGILHRDIKPSNILISAEGQPLLLDFNLSPSRNDDAEHATIGGTLAYMAPEHLRALAGRTPALIRQVDERSDIYSLGMVLAEMLTGRRPFEQSGSYSALPLQIEAMAVVRSTSALSIRAERPDISWGLESIIRKCLAPEPAKRYQRADQLSDDLRRLIEDRTLAHAPELSRVERGQKFLRRHPRLTSAGVVAAIATVCLLAAGTALAAMRSQLADTAAKETVRAHDAGMFEALCLVNTRVEMRDNLREGIAACERTLALLGAAEDPDWHRRAIWQRINPTDRHRLAEDRRELMLLLADARVRLAGGSRESIESALTLLDRAETIAGLPPSRALWLDRARYQALLGAKDQAKLAETRALEIEASTARDHYLLATSIARQGGQRALGAAIAELNDALQINPRHYWSLVQRGICHLERGEPVEAAADFGQCVGLWPEFAWGYFNRGCVLDRIGNRSAAIDDFSAALQRDPSLVPALVNRGLAELELKRNALALDDFDRAHALGSEDPGISAGRGIALERLGRHDQADAAFADCFAHADGVPAAMRARLAWAYGFAITARSPEKASAAFDDALRYDPTNFQALYGRAMLAMSQGKNAEAIHRFEQALRASPGRIDARRYRAIALARKGDWTMATQEINRCLELEPSAPETLYCAACVVAIAFERVGTSAHSAQALDLLERALAAGIDPKRPITDPDLASIRHLSRFERIVSHTHPSR